MLDFHFQHPTHPLREHICVHTPHARVLAHTPAQVLPALAQLQAWQAQGYWAAGYMAYEAAAGLDSHMAALLAPHMQQARPALPLLYFEIFSQPQPSPTRMAEGPYSLSAWQPAQAQAAYEAAIAHIKTAIASGQSYQVNYTLPFDTQFTGDDYALYHAMRRAQRAPYAAYLQVPTPAGTHSILSASPELFFHWAGPQAGGHILTKPMKGTHPRGLWSAQDDALMHALQQSAKDRAENVMIVDLLRNDLGRIARTGSVQVDALFSAERYPSVWQLTSTVSARTRPDVQLPDLLQALFPCGSITGTPKLETMKLIAQLEAGPRHVYCGSIGLLRPDGSATFNVAIRTMHLAPGQADADMRAARYHAGSGITWSSEPSAEWQETLQKTRVVQAAFLQQNSQAFDLIETLLWDAAAQQFTLLDEHLARMQQSAAYFSRPFDADKLLRILRTTVAGAPHTMQRVRALLGADGSISASTTTLDTLRAPDYQVPARYDDSAAQAVALARGSVHSSSVWLYHKTTHRDAYTRALTTARETHGAAVFDAVLMNERDELCETTIGNLVLQCGANYYTPPLACGLLPGTMRAALLERGQLSERVLYAHDFNHAQGAWLINSVRGWVPIRLINPVSHNT